MVQFGRQIAETLETLSYLHISLAILGIGLSLLAGFAIVEFIKTMRSARRLADDLDERVVPLLDKVDVTVDAVNAELLRIDGIVSKFEDVSDKVSSTTNAVSDVVNAPMDAVGHVSTRLRDVWKTARRSRRG